MAADHDILAFAPYCRAMFTVLTCITQDHDWRLLLPAVAICAIAATTALNMLGRAGDGRGRGRWAWVGGAAAAFGGGVWATHFIAMLAFRAPLPIDFAFEPTLLSVIVAVLGMLPAFALLIVAPRSIPVRTAGGLIAGSSIAAMHYIGMSAVRLRGTLIWDPTLVEASILLGLGLSVCGFLLLDRCQVTGRRLGASAVMMLAICGLHFTGMAAVTVLPGGGGAGAPISDNPIPLATAIAVITLLILLGSQVGSIIDRRFSDHAARQARRFRQLADASSEGVLIHAGGDVLDINLALCRMLGCSPESVLGRPMSELFDCSTLDGLMEHAAGANPTELDLHPSWGGTLPVEARHQTIEHEGRLAEVLLLHDLRERRAAQDRIHHMAHHDALTGLANRFLFNDRLAQAIAQAAREPGPQLAVLYLDLNRFKPVNDVLGHQAGDTLLQQTATRLRDAVRQVDTVARLGGDEFAIIQIGQAQPKAAAALGARLTALLGEPHDIGGTLVTIAASIGVAIFPTDAVTADALLQQADIALYRAKHDARCCGAGTVRFFEPEMDLQVRARRQLEVELRHAIGTEQMEVHYQPLRRGADSSIAGYEALIRWHHPERGWVSPAEFIPLAEESGLIIALGQWVLETACAQATHWPDSCAIAVNLSPVQFRQPELVDNIARVLRQTGLTPSRLELEVTEGVLIENAELALVILHRLKALGVAIALDDFGTGYSSLSYLSRFPFDKIKIDKSFVHDMLHDSSARAIVQAVIGLGRTLDRRVTAEGVETDAQADYLRAQACDQLQGYLLGRPRPAGDLDVAFAQPATTATAIPVGN